MQQQTQELPEIKLVGLATRTKNAQEMDPATGKIGPLVQRYHQDNIAEGLQQRLRPGVTYCVYTEYESDFTGEYTFFIGERVSAFDDVGGGLKSLCIPVQTYANLCKIHHQTGADAGCCHSGMAKDMANVGV